MIDLRQFLAESNKIEGIFSTNEHEVKAAQEFLDLESMSIADLANFVQVVQPDAMFRDRDYLNVVVGSHRPPRGGVHIKKLVMLLLGQVNAGDISPYRAHVEYERIHPFTDGNGRSGRLLWLWQMQREGLYSPVLSFLHAFYYQTLAAKQEKA